MDSVSKIEIKRHYQNISIVLIEDDDEVTELIRYHLEKNKYRLHCASSIKDGCDYIEKYNPNLIILDLKLNGESGYDVCRRVKFDKVLKDIPILVVSASNDDIDIITSLELGADYYLTKPFSIKELIVKVDKLVSKTANCKTYDSFEVGPLFFDDSLKKVYLNGDDIDVSKTEYKLLHVVASNPGMIFRRETLNSYISRHNLTLNNINSHMKKIRRRLGEFSYLIETVRAVGYKFSSKFDLIRK